jgi:type VII secretion-associated serine protease mycosin
LQALWAQSQLGFINVWPITRGRGVTVAVVDSGVNSRHPQLAGRVTQSIDLTGTHNTDCFGHGTEVAGIIAAQDRRNSRNAVPFLGVAPDVKLISIKVQTGENGGDPQLLVRGIERAVALGVDIINVSITSVAPFPALQAAVRKAEQHDILVVASAGNTDPRLKKNEQKAYPASYPQVLSVGAVGPDGIADFSNTTSKVDVSAPGEDIISTVANGYVGQLEGTSFAAPYVAGVAALVKSAHPALTSRQIKNRLIGTANGSLGNGSGSGIINPYQAVTAIGDHQATPAPPQQTVARRIDIGGPRPVDHRAREIGALVAAGTIGAALLVVFGGVVAPIGARRGWRPGRLAPLRDDSDDESSDKS